MNMKRDNLTAVIIIAAGITALWVLSGLLGPRAHGATNYLEVGAGYNGSFFAQSDAHEWDDGGGVGATIEMGREWTVPKNEGRLKVKCRWLHVSQWDVGPPFNNRAESSLDHVGCAARLEF